MSGSSSDDGSLATISRSANFIRKSSIEIKLTDHYEAKIYTSGSPIRGEVVINPLRDTHFDSLQIIFLGVTRTRLEAVQVPQKSNHTFLKLNMPIPESVYPVPRVFEVGRTYTIPFNFVVPTTLTLSACSHATHEEYVSDYHMRLPPSMGSWARNDLAPATAEVEYMVKARAIRDAGEDRRVVRVFEAQHPINVLPASPEDPPLNITDNDRNYTTTKTKNIRKNLFSSKMGRFTATASQPPAVHLEPDGIRASGTAATLHLTFLPTSPNIPPPKVNTISAKLAATTYYSATPMTRLPNLGFRLEYATEPRLAYKTNVSLFNTTVGKVSWKQQSARGARRDSGYSTDHGDSDGDAPADSNKTAVYYTASLAIPFKLPVAKKIFLPTFHSCLVSRVYTLNLSLSVGPANNTVQLALPFQIAVEQTGSFGMEDLPSFDAAMAQDEGGTVDEYMTARVLRMPPSELQNSVLPGYDMARPRPMAA